MNSFKRKIDAVWNKAGTEGHAATEENHRYVPRATGVYEGNWRIFDRLEDRFLTDGDINRLPEEKLANEQLPTN